MVKEGPNCERRSDGLQALQALQSSTSRTLERIFDPGFRLVRDDARARAVFPICFAAFAEIPFWQAGNA
jgi:hypothetical protein